MFDIRPLCTKARAAADVLACTDTLMKNTALTACAARLEKAAPDILSANAEDVAHAAEAGITDVMIDRLRLDEKRVYAMAGAIRDVAALPDPIGEITSMTRRPNGLQIGRQRVPLGVVGMIYESRPNVTADVAALCVKSGNACILRGGKEAIRSNKAVAAALRGALESAGLPADCVQLIEDTSRDSAWAMMSAVGGLDVLIPRGGAGLIRSIVENARVPVIATGAGNCHVYVDDDCDMEMAANIVYNAKTSRPSVCNAAESLLVARSIAPAFLPLVKARLDQMNVELRGCPETLVLLPGIGQASEEDYYTEYNDYILSAKIVSGVDEAIAHINRYSTHHSDAIVTRDYFHAQAFVRRVDSAAVYVNASTRYTDGAEFGLGAEIGISTQKLHTRGPFALEALTSTKYIIYGEGQVR